MSDYLSRLKSRVLPKGYKVPDSSVALQPYVDEAQTQREDQLSLLQPVRLIFDILQRGQYLTANVGEEIIKSVRTGEPLGQAAMDALDGALAGITGKRKGDWTNVLFGGQTTGEEQKFEGLFPQTELPDWAKKAIGFAANVVLDPTTYVSFGATKGAVAGAQKYGKDAMELFIKEASDAGTLQKAITKGLDLGKVQELAKTAPEKVAEYLSKFHGDLGRTASEVYKKAYKTALRTPSKALQKGMQGEVENLTTPLYQRFQNLTEAGAKGRKPIQEQESILKSLEGLNRITESAKAGYGTEGGFRALKFGPFGMGQELFKGQRYPAHVQAWDKITQAFEASPVGEKLGDAWYAINNTGLLGQARKILGIRNPYESYVHNLAQSATEYRQAEQGVLWKQVNDTINQIPEEVLGPAQKAIQLAEHLNVKGGKQISGEYVVRDPAMITQYIQGLKGNDRLVAEELFQQVHGENTEQLVSAINNIKKLTDEYAMTAHKAVSEGIIGNFGERLAYLPNVTVDTTGGMARKNKLKGSETPSFTKTRSYTQTERVGQETAYVEWLLQVDKQTAQKLVEKNGIGNLSTDLREMLLYRAQGEARLKARMGIVEDFKKFGIPKPEAEEMLSLKLGRGTDTFRPVAGKAFEGLLFPTEVADVLEKISTHTADPGMKTLKGIWNSFTGWWKGFVTMTTGFHVRNFIQNNITGYLHHGVDWFNPREGLDAIVGTIHALAKDNPKPLLEQFAIGLDVYQRTLKKRIGNFSIEELADYGYYKGLVSKTTQAFDAQVYGKTGTVNLNPMSRGFVGAQASRGLGNIIENEAKMQSFLMDFKQAIGHSPEEWGKRLGNTVPYEQLKNLPEFKQSEYALEFAKNESKKWFFDYQDLTDAEKNVFRQVIPFYSWLRKNIPAQLATIWTNPSMYSLFPKGEAAVAMEGIDESTIPEWMRQSGYVPIRKDETGKVIFWSPNMAYLDLNKIPFLAKKGGGIKFEGQEIIDDIMGAAHPMIKQIVQQIPKKGYDVFLKRDLDYKATAPYILGFFTKSPKMLQLMDGIARLVRPEGLGFAMKDGHLVMDAKPAKLLQDNLPILRAMERTMMLGGQVIPGLDKAITELTGADSTYDGLSAFFQTLSYWGGVKFSLTDLEKEKERIAQDILDQAQTAKSKAEAGSPLAQKRSLAYKKGRQTLMRKVGL